MGYLGCCAAAREWPDKCRSPAAAGKEKKRTRIKVSPKNINQKQNTGTYRDIHEFYKKIMIMKCDKRQCEQGRGDETGEAED